MYVINEMTTYAIKNKDITNPAKAFTPTASEAVTKTKVNIVTTMLTAIFSDL